MSAQLPYYDKPTCPPSSDNKRFRWAGHVIRDADKVEAVKAVKSAAAGPKRGLCRAGASRKSESSIRNTGLRLVRRSRQGVRNGSRRMRTNWPATRALRTVDGRIRTECHRSPRVIRVMARKSAGEEDTRPDDGKPPYKCRGIILLCRRQGA